MKRICMIYPKCTTCKNGKKWLEENGIDIEFRDIVKENPTKDELKEIYEKSGLPIKRFFNTSGILYREMNLKEKVAKGDVDELLEILSTNGMLVKRPLVVGKDIVLVGFKEKEWEENKDKI